MTCLIFVFLSFYRLNSHFVPFSAKKKEPKNLAYGLELHIARPGGKKQESRNLAYGLELHIARPGSKKILQVWIQAPARRKIYNMHKDKGYPQPASANYPGIRQSYPQFDPLQSPKIKLYTKLFTLSTRK